MSRGAVYDSGIFQFLTELSGNNSREWFARNRERYETSVRSPSFSLIRSMDGALREISPVFVADPRPVGGSLFQISRDMRFAKDKVPYKTHVGITFRHSATLRTPRTKQANASMGKLDAPMLYLHIEPDQSFAACGIWRPQKFALARIREYIVRNPISWMRVSRQPELAYGWTLGGTSLVRMPRGFDQNHELAVDIKRQDFIAGYKLSNSDLTSGDLVEMLTARYREASPLYDWLCGALDLEF